MSFLPAASLIQNLPLSVPMPSTAPSNNLVRAPAPPSYIANFMEEEPLFNSKTGKADMNGRPQKVRAESISGLATQARSMALASQFGHPGRVPLQSQPT